MQDFGNWLELPCPSMTILGPYQEKWTLTRGQCPHSKKRILCLGLMAPDQQLNGTNEARWSRGPLELRNPALLRLLSQVLIEFARPHR